MSNCSVNELEHCRSVLLRVLKGISDEELDFQIFPDSKSIGELLLHVAGFEFLMVSGAHLLAGHEAHLHLWHNLKLGFSREAGWPPPKGRSLKDYLEALAEVRGQTVRYLGANAERRMVSKTTFPIGALAGLLRDNDPEPDVEHYVKIAAGVGRSFSDDGAENQKGEVDLVNLLMLHETYHRGQITLQKYLYTHLHQS
jgi:DinB superfamily